MKGRVSIIIAAFFAGIMMFTGFMTWVVIITAFVYRMQIMVIPVEKVIEVEIPRPAGISSKPSSGDGGAGS